MIFFENYIFFSLLFLTILTTFSLKLLFEKTYEKAGLVLLWSILIGSVLLDINKFHLLWLAPSAFILPYYIYKAVKIIPYIKFNYALRYFISLFF